MKDNVKSAVAARLRQFLAAKRISQAEFCDDLNLSRSYILSIRQSISRKVQKGIAEHYPDLNLDWLLDGEGEMFNNSAMQSGTGNNQNVATNINNTGTFTQGAVESEEKTLYKEVISLLKEQIQALKDEKDAFLTRVGCPSLADVEKKMDELKNQK